MELMAIGAIVTYVGFFLATSRILHYKYLNENKSKLEKKVYDFIDEKITEYAKKEKKEREMNIKKLSLEITKAAEPIRDLNDTISLYNKEMLIYGALTIVFGAGTVLYTNLSIQIEILNTLVPLITVFLGLMVFYTFIQILTSTNKLKLYLENGESYEN